MAHFAKLDDNNKVIAIHVVNNDVLIVDNVESEQIGIDFLTSLHGHNNWKQTSYNSSFRGKYAAIGDTYDSILDEFISSKIYDSWIYNTELSIWEAPIPCPNDGKLYDWDEETLSWIERFI